MKPLPYLAVLLLAAGCARHQPTAHRPFVVPVAPIAAPAVPGLATPAVAGRPGLLGLLLGRPTQAVAVPGGRPVVLGKKSVVNIYNAPATITTNTAAKNGAAGPGAVSAVKSAGPVAGAAGVASDQKKATNAVQHQGNGDGIEQRATVARAGFPWGKVLAGVGALGVGALGWWAWPWLLVLLRRRKDTDKTA